MTTTQDDIDFSRRRATALAHPLRRRDRLTWRGPARHPETLAPDAHLDQSSPSPTPHRPPFEVLLSETGPARSNQTWELELVEPIQIGESRWCKWSQVWRVKAYRRDGTDEQAQLVVKLYDEALFPNFVYALESGPQPSQRFTPAELERREAAVYERGAALQGRNLCNCYGFYTFNIRGTEQVSGVVLEDLSHQAHNLEDYVLLMKKRGEYTFEMAQSVIWASHEVLARLQGLDLALVAPNDMGIFVLDKYEPEEHHVVFVGFGRSQTAEERMSHLLEKEPDFVERWPVELRSRCWLHTDHFRMGCVLSAVFDDEFRRWQEETREDERNLFAEDPLIEELGDETCGT
ncbi:hypothetical protein JCM11491_002854 [Sporobolomyces phaffii]